MTARPHVLVICGTRPDAIKLAPVIKNLRQSEELQTTVVATGQHREMLKQVFDAFDLEWDVNLDVMSAGQSLSRLTSSMIDGLDRVLVEQQPDLVVAQGDTTTTFAASLVAFYHRRPFAHVEAGLRTADISVPFPEEFNRRAAALTTALHFAPTAVAAANLRGEGVRADAIDVTGNTSIDALLSVTDSAPPIEPFAGGHMLLVTTHRRENWGEPQRQICQGVQKLLDERDDIHVVLPLHPNPRVRETIASSIKSDRAFLIDPPSYPAFARLMMAAHIILTDSGGVQEEAPSLGKPVLVLREETERPEGVDAGNAILVGTDPSRILSEASKLLDDEGHYASVAQARNPYGDGQAAGRIVNRIREFLA